MKQELLQAGWSMQSGNPKHRYVYVLDQTDKALIARVEHMRQPYPKREHAAGAADVAPDDQSGEGGLIPTPPLHSEADA